MLRLEYRHTNGAVPRMKSKSESSRPKCRAGQAKHCYFFNLTPNISDCTQPWHTEHLTMPPGTWRGIIHLQHICTQSSTDPGERSCPTQRSQQQGIFKNRKNPFLISKTRLFNTFVKVDVIGVYVMPTVALLGPLLQLSNNHSNRTQKPKSVSSADCVLALVPCGTHSSIWGASSPPAH